MSASGFEPTLACAQALDAADPVADFRDAFHIPPGPDGKPGRYFCGNSLGLEPKGVQKRLEQELSDWARLAVRGHLEAAHPWYNIHREFQGPLSRVVGAGENEVVLMNSLTVNLHLLMVSFYRPTRERFKILMEAPAFPSDTYAMHTQARHHGFDPAEAVVTVGPREGDHTVREEDLEAAIDRHRGELAVVLVGGVNFLSGQCFDMERLARAARAAGAVVGFDLAHAAGNVPLRLHDWNVDFAAWCSYKYLNGGPGAMAGAFVHERHVTDRSLPRFGGWWGNDPDTRFRLHLEPEFVPVPRADAWQISNPSVFSLAPLAVSLDLFERAGMEALREKSVRLTGYLEYLLEAKAGAGITVTTPKDPARRGCQLSLMLAAGAETVEERLREQGLVADFRRPNVLRVAPTPLYNTYADVWHLVEILSELS